MIQMHRVYKESLTPEVQKMFERLDRDALQAEVLRRCAALEEGADFWNDLGKLVLTAGLLDSLKGGRACALLCDVVNF